MIFIWAMVAHNMITVWHEKEEHATNNPGCSATEHCSYQAASGRQPAPDCHPARSRAAALPGRKRKPIWALLRSRFAARWAVGPLHLPVGAARRDQLQACAGGFARRVCGAWRAFVLAFARCSAAPAPPCAARRAAICDTATARAAQQRTGISLAPPHHRAAERTLS